MKETIKKINSKTDDRFIYAIGLFVLLSICMERFPSVNNNSQDKQKKEIIASDSSDTNNSVYRLL